MNFLETALSREDIYFALILMSMTYSWKCLECKHKFEEMVKYEERSSKCPKCGGKIEQKYTESRAVWKTKLGR